jgi:hypothetical protein
VPPEPAAPPPDPARTGAWSKLATWPVSATHAALLPTGKVLFVGEFEEGDLPPRLWDPSTEQVSVVPHPGHNVFCGGHAFLADGTLLFAGGHAGLSHFGLADAILLDPVKLAWRAVDRMNAARWYPTATTLADGQVLVASGEIAGGGDLNRLPQVLDPATGRWRDLTRAERAIPMYPRMFVAPNGKVFVAGPQPTSYYLDTAGEGAWQLIAFSRHGARDYGSAVLYGDGKVLMAGGDDPPTASAEVIDLRQPSPAWRAVAPMSVPRRQHNATLLPDGTVLVTGGSRAPGFDEHGAPVFGAELWDPATETWTRLARAAVYRGYHSTALLLPDGRVVTGGGRFEHTAQVFSPPYLFHGPRPRVGGAPDRIAPAATFHVETADAPDVASINLVRLGATTHAFDHNQRFVRLAFTVGEGGLEVTAPARNRDAPPGHYLLFLVNRAGVPSIGRIVRVELAPEPIGGGPSGGGSSEETGLARPDPPSVFPVEGPAGDGPRASAGGGGCGSGGASGPAAAAMGVALVALLRRWRSGRR